MNEVKYIKVKNPAGHVNNFLLADGYMQSEEIRVNGKKLTEAEFKKLMSDNGFEIIE